QLPGRDLVLVDAVEAAAVDLPRLAADAFVGVPRWAQVVVERNEVEGGADPRDCGDHVQPAGQQIEPVGRVLVERRECRHRSSATGGSSAPAVSSSSSRVRSSRARSTSRISVFGRRLTKTTNRNPNFSSYT